MNTNKSPARFKRKIVVSKLGLQRNWSETAAAALRIDKCAKAIAPYTTGPSKFGHPVIDMAAAVEALIATSPEPFKARLSMSGLTMWDKVQALRVALRSSTSSHRVTRP